MNDSWIIIKIGIHFDNFYNFKLIVAVKNPNRGYCIIIHFKIYS